jgi:D-alanyl-D-alanine carboxypeptidase/D-alanyl-D-alanine-endopeptidase (penicillin-binding protein 4)
MRKRFLCLILCFLSASSLIFLVQARSDTTGLAAPAPERLITDGGYAVEKSNRLIASYNLQTLYAPASILKIATALAALEILGPDYRFTTNFFLDGQHNLYIQGFGDPFLISEEVAAIVVKLKELGCTEINDIYLDSTAFKLPAAADGAGTSDNPYDVQNSGLAVNFNTVNIRKDKSGRIVSAEEQTPTLALMAELAEGLPPGLHRINISREEDDGAVVISRYAGELFRALQKQAHIAGQGRLAAMRTPEYLTPFYIHRSSKTLEEVIEPLLLYSNNFIANQIFLTLGAQTYGYPATWEKSTRAMADYLQKKHYITGKDMRVVEGSGLSRKNRVSPGAMILLLDSFKPYARLLPREGGRFVKSGTLKGVYSYAGYFLEGERLDSFVLLLNQEKNNRDRVLDLLERIYLAN